MKKLIVIIASALILLACENTVVETVLLPTAVVGIEAPSEVTPLSTILTLGSVNKGTIEVLVKGKTPEMDIAHVYPAGYGTKFPIHGMYADYNNTIVITGITDGINITTNILTRSTLANNATVSIDELDAPDKYNQDLYFYNSSSTYIAAADREGDIRYYQKLGGVSLDGQSPYTLHSVFFDEKRNEILTKDDRGISDLFGNTFINYPKDTMTNKPDVHHDSIKKGNNYLILSFSEWGLEDRIKEITPAGVIINDKTFGSLFRDVVSSTDLTVLNQIIYDDDNIYEKNGVQNAVDWAHANSLVYDSTTDILYLSLREQGVIAVDYSEWKLIWWMTDETLDTNRPEAVPNRGTNFIDIPSLAPYRVKDIGQTDGPKNQHALLLKNNGNIAMFDNQGDESTNSNGSRYVEYAITGNHGSWMANIASNYINRTLYSRYRSDIDLTGNNHQNILIAYAFPKKIIEVDVTNKVLLFEMNLNLSYSAIYRADKMPLYPYSNSNKKYSIEYNEKEGL